MSVYVGAGWEYKDLKFFGVSLSGIRTSIALPELSVAFDVAQGFPYLFNIKNFFVTHGHLDHAAGIPYLISQKAMASQGTPHFYMPASVVEPMKKIMQQWSEIEKHEYKFHFHPILGKEKIDLNKSYFVRPFKTIHRVDSFGYTLFHRKTKLKNEFLNLPKNQLIDLRRSGTEIVEIRETPLVSFTGDTQIEFLDQSDWVADSQILFLEATYLDDSKPISSAKEWGHTHLDEIIQILPSLKCERIVLIHVSSRYSFEAALKILAQKIPEEFRERVVLFPGR